MIGDYDGSLVGRKRQIRRVGLRGVRAEMDFVVRTWRLTTLDGKDKARRDGEARNLVRGHTDTWLGVSLSLVVPPVQYHQAAASRLGCGCGRHSPCDVDFPTTDVVVSALVGLIVV